MDYFKKIEESIKFAWNNKQLWWFGFIIALFGGGFSFSYSSNSSGDGSDATEFSTKMNDFLNHPTVIILLICLVFLFILIALIGWYFSSISKSALIEAVILDQQKKKLTFREGWKYGKTKAFKIILLDLILFLFALGLLIILSPIFILTVFSPVLWICMCCLIIPIIFLACVPLFVLKTSAIRYIVIKNMGPWESLKATWRSMKKAYIEYSISTLIAFVFALIMIAFFVMLFVFPAILILLIFVGLVLFSPLIGLLFIGIAGLLLMLSFAALEAPFLVGFETYWTKIVMELMDKYDQK